MISDNEYAMILIGSLPVSYAGMLNLIAASTEMSRMAASPAVVTKLATDEYDCCTLQNNKAQDEAFAAKSQKKGKHGKGWNVQCENCHKTCHTKDQCWAKGGRNEGGGPRRKGKKDDTDKSNAATTANEPLPEIEAWAIIDEPEDNDADPCVPEIVAMTPLEGQSELYDSGALCHMSPFHKQFVTYQKITTRPITAANNKVFHAIGMGDL